MHQKYKKNERFKYKTENMLRHYAIINENHESSNPLSMESI